MFARDSVDYESDYEVEIEKEMYYVRNQCLNVLKSYDINTWEDITDLIERYYENDDEATLIFDECKFFALERAALKGDIGWFSQEVRLKRDEDEAESRYFEELENQGRDYDIYFG
jgi:hypothetical protein